MEIWMKNLDFEIVKKNKGELYFWAKKQHFFRLRRAKKKENNRNYYIHLNFRSKNRPRRGRKKRDDKYLGIEKSEKITLLSYIQIIHDHTSDHACDHTSDHTWSYIRSYMIIHPIIYPIIHIGSSDDTTRSLSSIREETESVHPLKSLGACRLTGVLLRLESQSILESGFGLPLAQ